MAQWDDIKCGACGSLLYEHYDDSSKLVGRCLNSMCKQYDQIITVHKKKEDPKRKEVDYLFTCLDWNFIKALGQLGKSGQKSQEDEGNIPNYQKVRRTGDKSNINHLINHITSYICKEPHPLGSRKWHLVAIAFNAMMEFFWVNKEDDDTVYPQEKISGNPLNKNQEFLTYPIDTIGAAYIPGEENQSDFKKRDSVIVVDGKCNACKRNLQPLNLEGKDYGCMNSACYNYGLTFLTLNK